MKITLSFTFPTIRETTHTCSFAGDAIVRRWATYRYKRRDLLRIPEPHTVHVFYIIQHHGYRPHPHSVHSNLINQEISSIARMLIILLNELYYSTIPCVQKVLIGRLRPPSIHCCDPLLPRRLQLPPLPGNFVNNPRGYGGRGGAPSLPEISPGPLGERFWRGGRASGP